MAIVKHIKSRNANYSAAINYLLFEHDEKTGKKIVDESGRSILRKEFYMDGLNCDPMSFDKECELTNAHFHKNKKREDIKSHHYIISYDPSDVTENGLTGPRAHAISLELAKQMFPGYQALVVTHTDGHNESGNIHTHIVINSVRKTAVERQPYMDKPHEEAAGYKHRSTDKFMNTFKKTVMDRCQQEGLHQIDLLAPAERKITQKEYMAQKHGQQKLDEINQKIIEDGLKPTSTVFLTQKDLYVENIIIVLIARMPVMTNAIVTFFFTTITSTHKFRVVKLFLTSIFLPFGQEASLALRARSIPICTSNRFLYSIIASIIPPSVFRTRYP